MGVRHYVIHEGLEQGLNEDSTLRGDHILNCCGYRRTTEISYGEHKVHKGFSSPFPLRELCELRAKHTP
jgi:hypothetical protein